MSNLTQKDIKRLEKRENKIWEMLENVLGSDDLEDVSELIEINILLDAESGR